MSAFLVVHSTVKDPAKFQAYASAVGPTLAPFGGEVHLRGKLHLVLHGEHAHETVGILKFPDANAAVRWYRSAAYQALVQNRNEAADLVVLSFNEPPQ